MNDQNDHHQNARTDIEGRVQRHLRSVSDQATFTTAGPGSARRRAHQRTVSRRRVGAVGLAAASIAGAIAGVSVLSQPANTTLRSSDTPADSATPAPEPVVEDDTPSVVPGTVAPVVGAELQTVDAIAADPAFVWKVVEPEPGAAVIGTFGNSVDRFPGLALSTAPGRSNDYDDIEQVVWRTNDGIEFERSDLGAPFSTSFWQPTIVGDNVFAVGTAPGVAETEPNFLQVARTGFADSEWQTVELPFDTNAGPDLPNAYTGLIIDRTAVGDGLLVSVTHQVGVDIDAAMRSSDLDPQAFRMVSEIEGGIGVSDADCVEQLEMDSSSYTSVSTTPATIAGVESSGSIGPCPITEYTWEEIGVPAETIAAVENQNTEFFFVGVDGTVTDVESPVPGAVLHSYQGAGAARFAEQNWWAYDDPSATIEVFEYDGAAWSSSEQPVMQANFSSTPVDFLGGLAGMAYGGDASEYFATVGPDGAVTNVDLTGLLGADQDSFQTGGSSRAALAGEQLVSVVEQYPDLIARAGGVELKVDGITARQDRVDQQAYFEDADGERIPDERLSYGREGGVVVADADGNTIAEFSDQQLYDEMVGAVYENGADAGVRSTLLTTSDGRSFSSESVADLLGLTDGEVNRVQRVSTDGTTVVVAVALNDRHPDDSRKQLVLVGTPIG